MERDMRVRGRDFPSSSLGVVSATQRASASSTSHKGGREVIKIEIPAARSKPRSTYRRRHLRLIPTHFFVLIVLCVILGRACAFAPLHTRRIALPTSPYASRPPPNFRIFLFGFGGNDSQTNKNGGNSSLKPRPFAPERMVKYNDDIFAKIWIFLFTGKIAAVVGAPSPRNFIPYEEYVRLSRLLLRGGSTKAKSAVLSVLRSIAFPGFSSIFRTLFPGSSRLACEFNARVTPIFFSWLVGPAKVETSEMLNPVTGARELWSNSVKIERCRYLESVQCKGACVSICKLPTQTFFTEDLGMPVTMTPNFEDLSCTMTFGTAPLPIASDPVCSEGCYKECSTAVTSKRVCPVVTSAADRK